MVVPEEIEREKLLEGLNYLYRHTLEAHHAGDGMQVLHHATIALRKTIRFGKSHPEFKLEIREVRWAFIFGMYWLVHTTFLSLVKEGLDHVSCEGPNHSDSQTVILIYNFLSQPHLTVELNEIDAISSDWWVERSNNFSEEDSVALTFAIELIWHSEPSGTNWNSLVTKWINNISNESLIKARLETLQKRLEFQSGLYDGTAFQEFDNDDLPEADPIQIKLFRGWVAFYNCDWEELSAIISQLNHQISVDQPAYELFFQLINVSRLYRSDNDDYSISVSRIFLARSRRPERIFGLIRSSYLNSQFTPIILAGSPTNALAGNRLSHLCISMLLKLQSLRSWDIGSWRIGMGNSAQSKLEIGSLGDEQAAIGGILDSARGRITLNPEKSPHLKSCLQLLDNLDVKRRRFVTQNVLELNPIEWRSAYIILKELSDAIPEDMLSELTDWTLKVESTDLLKTHHIRTFINIWENILPFASEKISLIEKLSPALKILITNPFCWQDLHGTIIAAIVHGSLDIALELSNLLISPDCNIQNLNEWRFSIAYNVLELRPEVGTVFLQYFKNNAKENDDIFLLEILNNFEKKNDSDSTQPPLNFKEITLKNLFETIEKRKTLEDSEYNLSRIVFHDRAKLIKWPKAEPRLVKLLIDSIDDEQFLLVDKRDYLKFLGVLVRNGPLNQSKEISKHSIRWLIEGIKGKIILPDSGGPLSRTQVHGFGEYRDALFYLLEESALRCPSTILMDLVDWLPSNISHFLPQFSANLLHIELALIITAQKKSDQIAAILSGLADTTASLSLADNAVHIVRAFEYIVTNACLDQYEILLANDKVWCRTFVNQWIARFLILSEDTSPEVRVSLARIVRSWIHSDLPHRNEMLEIHDLLSQDCRLRVRHAIDSAEEGNNEE